MALWELTNLTGAFRAFAERERCLRNGLSKILGPAPNRSIGWSFKCAECHAKYVFSMFRDVIILRTDAEKHSALQATSNAANAEVRKVAARHEEQKSNG
jgi:hypothetical protein